MTWKPRLVEPEELAAAIDLTAMAFGVGPRATDDYRKQVSLVAEPDRVFVVEDGGVVAGTGATYSMALALPGGGTLPLAGVTEVAVSPTHRRRGILRALIDAVHDQAFERGEPIAGLTASEGGIYRRFGYGIATRYQSLAIDRAAAGELDPLTTVGTDGDTAGDSGRVRLVSEAEAADALPAVWERHWPRVPGEVRRPAAWWEMLALDPEDDRDGASARHIAVHEGADGTADGFAIYRIKEGEWGNSSLPFTLRLESLAGADDRVEAALERFVLGVDLVATVEWRAAPIDVPLRWRLANPRTVRVTAEKDHLWLRPFDVAAVLSARRYAVGGACVVEVVDSARPALGGRFRLEGGPEGATCTRTDAEPDLLVGVADLGSLLLGGITWRTLRRAGLVEERTPGAAGRADTMFQPERPPYCSTEF